MMLGKVVLLCDGIFLFFLKAKRRLFYLLVMVKKQGDNFKQRDFLIDEAKNEIIAALR